MGRAVQAVAGVGEVGLPAALLIVPAVGAGVASLLSLSERLTIGMVLLPVRAGAPGVGSKLSEVAKRTSWDSLSAAATTRT